MSLPGGAYSGLKHKRVQMRVVKIRLLQNFLGRFLFTVS